MRLGVDVGGTFTDLLLHDESAPSEPIRPKNALDPQDQSDPAWQPASK